ncbi:hypothetical protein BVU76_08715 [Mycolicibacterium porcinum]|nr:hypothetical protein BVU76_08715 [Mycolicibacterium porcinum]
MPSGYPGHGFPLQPQPPKRGNGWKWALGGVAILAVIGVTAAVTVAVVKTSDGGGPDSPTATPSTASASTVTHPDIASANDTGPVAVILEDPSCATRYPVLSTFESRTKNGWDKRDPKLAAPDWTPEVRSQYEAAGQAFRDAADQIIPSAKLTPHRGMRQLYEQFIAYAREYADSIPAYTPVDNQLALATISASDAIDRICAAIGYGSAAARGPLVPALQTPSEVAPVRDPDDAEKLLDEPNPVCPEWDSALEHFLATSEPWRATNPDSPRAEWSSEQEKATDEAVPAMRLFNTQLSSFGRQSENPTLRDLANLAVQYRQAYLESIPTYTPADKYLVDASIRISSLVAAACRALG